MPRFLSAVTILASSFPTVWTQTWSTSLLSGAMNATLVASGEMFGDVLLGLPNNTFRGISGGSAALAETVAANKTMALQNWTRIEPLLERLFCGRNID